MATSITAVEGEPWYQYRARLDRVVDGDTLDIHFDLGFQIEQSARVRLAGVDTAEVYGVPVDSDEYARGKEQSRFVTAWLEAAGAEWDADPYPILVETEQDQTGKYGRYLCDVIRRSDSQTLVASLIDRFPEVED